MRSAFGCAKVEGKIDQGQPLPTAAFGMVKEKVHPPTEAGRAAGVPMGIYDREYYRREGPGFLESFSTQGKACKWLIAINIVCFFLQLAIHPQPDRRDADLDDMGGAVAREAPGFDFKKVFELDTEAVLHGQVWRLVTYAFLHAGLGHIFWNMLFLWFFGKDVETLYGTREFTLMYLASAVVGALFFVAGSGASLQLPGGAAQHLVFGGARCIGASGAVMAVTVLCAMHYPSRIILLFFVLPVPIWIFVAFQVAQDLFGFLGGGGGDNTAFSVHLGGAAFAFAYYKLHWRLDNLVPNLRLWMRQRTGPKLRVYHGEPAERVAVPTPTASDSVDEHLEAKVDAVLEKVKRTGMDSLTDKEKQILARASEVYKRRRT